MKEATRFRLPIVRSGAWVACVLLAAVVATTALADDGAAHSVRVLLMRTREPLMIAGVGPGRERVRLRAVADGVRVAGGSVRPFWRGKGPSTLALGKMAVRGTIEVRGSAGWLSVVNEVPLEDYVAGTLGREMYASWQSAALQAQAVASRTYAVHQANQRQNAPYDVSATTSSQVYGGVAAESSATRTAVRATRGEVLTYRGEPILAAFHSASGGQTASAGEVWGRPVAYLVSVSVEDEEDSPDTYWRAAISRTTLRRALAGLGIDIGTPRGARVIERSDSGRVRRMEFHGSGGRAEIGGRSLRSALGASTLRSTLFEVRSPGDEFVFVGSGRGHGVGMSQWGAQALAVRGATYREILEAFYPGTALRVLGASEVQEVAQRGRGAWQ